MPLHGVSHIGLSTLDLDATRTFYERVLGFRLVTIEQIDAEEGGCIRHAFFDCGDGQLLAFMEPRGIEGQWNTTPASIEALGCPTFSTTSPSTLVSREVRLDSGF